MLCSTVISKIACLTVQYDHLIRPFLGQAIAVPLQEASASHAEFDSDPVPQMLHCVRHGQSTFNAATNTMASFADPDIFDAALTLLGRRQAWPPSPSTDHAFQCSYILLIGGHNN